MSGQRKCIYAHRLLFYHKEEWKMDGTKAMMISKISQDRKTNTARFL
jgi:hypothetical protein